MPSPTDRQPEPPSGRDADRRLQDLDRSENAAQTSRSVNSELNDLKAAPVGETIPDAKETEDAATTASELFFEAAGLDKIPSAGTVRNAARAAEIQAQRAEGVSRAQNVIYIDARGETMMGAQYTRGDGTYFKTAEGLIFQVEANQQNGFDLRLINGYSETFVAVNMGVMRDVFAPGSENLAPPRADDKDIDTPAVDSPTASELMQNKESSAFSPQEAEATLNATPAPKAEDGPNTSDMTNRLNTMDMADGKPEPATNTTNLAELKLELAPPAAITAEAPPEAQSEAKAQSAILPEEDREPALALDVIGIASGKTESTLSHAEAEMIPPIVPFVPADISTPKENNVSENVAQLVAAGLSEKELKEREEAERVEREAIKLRIQQREEGRRRRYVVKDKDTLASIALKQFKDVRIANLIYEINRHLIPVKVVRGRRVHELKARMIIFLPTSGDIEKFRYGQQPEAMALDDTKGEEIENETASLAEIAVEGALEQVDFISNGAIPVVEEPAGALANQALDRSEPSPDPRGQQKRIRHQEDVAATPKAREGSEERVYYNVRLGDTLKSIAVRQPSLSDPSLWVLLAAVNGLSDTVDAMGNPETKLVRGMRLGLPTQSEIETFKQTRKDSRKAPKT